jgi:UDP-glucose 4-epimerase
VDDRGADAVSILITGATGFIGRHLVRELAGRHELVALARGAPPDDLAGPAQWVRQDLREPLRTDRLPQRVDAVIHLAQSPRYKDFPDGAEDMYAVNVQSTFRLLEWARDASAQTFILASTGGLYPYAPAAIEEDAALDPVGFYFRSKHAAEILVGAYADLMRTVVLRPFFVYGTGQRRMLIARLADQISRREEVVVEGDPGLRINPVHVDDMVRVFEPVLSGSYAGVVNVAGPDVAPISEIVGTLAEAMGVEPIVRHAATAREGDLVASIGRMRGRLGVDPQVGLAEGLRRVAGSVALHR